MVCTSPIVPMVRYGEALRDDTVWLRPTVGRDKLMRDPSIVQDELVMRDAGVKDLEAEIQRLLKE